MWHQQRAAHHQSCPWSLCLCASGTGMAAMTTCALKRIGLKCSWRQRCLTCKLAHTCARSSCNKCASSHHRPCHTLPSHNLSMQKLLLLQHTGKSVGVVKVSSLQHTAQMSCLNIVLATGLDLFCFSLHSVPSCLDAKHSAFPSLLQWAYVSARIGLQAAPWIRHGGAPCSLLETSNQPFVI